MKHTSTIKMQLAKINHRLGLLQGSTSHITKKNLLKTVHIPITYSRKDNAHILKATIGSGTGYSEIFCAATLADNNDNTSTIKIRTYYSTIYRVLMLILLAVTLFYSGEQIYKLVAGGNEGLLSFRALLNMVLPVLISVISWLVYSIMLDKYSRLLMDFLFQKIQDSPDN